MIITFLQSGIYTMSITSDFPFVQLEIAAWNAWLPQSAHLSVQRETVQQSYAKLILVNRFVLVVGVVWNAKEAAVSKGAHQATVSCSARVTQRNVIRVAQSTKTSAPQKRFKPRPRFIKLRVTYISLNKLPFHLNFVRALRLKRPKVSFLKQPNTEGHPATVSS